MLAMHDPMDTMCQTQKCKILDQLEMVVFTCFATEMAVKMVAMGVLGRKGYFSDRWNILDFFIVVAG